MHACVHARTQHTQARAPRTRMHACMHAHTHTHAHMHTRTHTQTGCFLFFFRGALVLDTSASMPSGWKLWFTMGMPMSSILAPTAELPIDSQKYQPIRPREKSKQANDSGQRKRFLCSNNVGSMQCFSLQIIWLRVTPLSNSLRFWVREGSVFSRLGWRFRGAAPDW